MKLARDDLDHAGGRGQIKYVVRLGLPFRIVFAEVLAEIGESPGIGEVGFLVMHVRGEVFPVIIFGFAAAGELIDGFAEVFVITIIVEIEPIDAEHGEVLRQPVIEEEVV